MHIGENDAEERKRRTEAKDGGDDAIARRDFIVPIIIMNKRGCRGELWERDETW